MSVQQILSARALSQVSCDLFARVCVFFICLPVLAENSHVNRADIASVYTSNYFISRLAEPPSSGCYELTTGGPAVKVEGVEGLTM